MCTRRIKTEVNTICVSAKRTVLLREELQELNVNSAMWFGTPSTPRANTEASYLLIGSHVTLAVCIEGEALRCSEKALEQEKNVLIDNLFWFLVHIVY